MAFCGSCGAQMQDGAGKCPACGAVAGAPAAAVPVANTGGGMTDNMAGALSYITIVGIIFLLIEPYNKNKFVRFHAFQSIFYCVGLIAFWIVWEICLVILGIISTESFSSSAHLFHCWCGWAALSSGSSWFTRPTTTRNSSCRSSATFRKSRLVSKDHRSLSLS